jgi:hypothetical protein
MDALLVGVLGAMAALAGLFSWLLMARPEALLGLWRDVDDADWPAHHPGAVRLLRWLAVGLTFLFGFLTGLAMAFLSRTS